MSLSFEIVSTREALELAFQIRRIVFIEEQQVPEELEMDEFDVSSTHFLVMNDGTPVGTARLRHYTPETTGKVERVAILETERGKGTGAALMRYIEDYARGHGFKELKLNSQYYAKDFYARLGYEGYGEIFLDAGIEHIAMTKKLD